MTNGADGEKSSSQFTGLIGRERQRDLPVSNSEYEAGVPACSRLDDEVDPRLIFVTVWHLCTTTSGRAMNKRSVMG